MIIWFGEYLETGYPYLAIRIIFRWQNYHTLYIIWRHRLIGIYNWESINIATIAISPHTDDMSNLIVRIIKSDSKHSFIPGFFMRKNIVKINLESLKGIPSHMKMVLFLIVILLLFISIRDVEYCYPYNILHDFKSNKKPQ